MNIKHVGRLIAIGFLAVAAAIPVSAMEAWYTPNGGSEDLIRLFQHPEEWQTARQQITVFGFFNLQLDGTPEGLYSLVGPNVLKNIVERSTVPGGPFKWLNDQGIKINIEAGAVKSWDCNDIMIAVRPTLLAMDNVVKYGGRVDYITIDESFAAGLLLSEQKWDWALPTCEFTEEQVADMVKAFVDEIHKKYPDVQIGFWEPYPFFSTEEIKRFLLLLKSKGVPVPFYSCDFNHCHAWQLGLDIRSELADLQQFCRDNGISFGINIIGDDGTSNFTYANGIPGDPCKNGAISMAETIKATVGMPDRIIFESWADHPPSRPVDLRLYPTNLPEWEPFTHTWLINNLLEFLRTQ